MLMIPKRLGELSEQIKRVYKFLRACHYDARSKRLELMVGRGLYDGPVRSAVIERAAEPSDLGRWTGHVFCGVLLYPNRDLTGVHINVGRMIAFTVPDEPESEPHREEQEA
jgi:hypothetical protein